MQVIVRVNIDDADITQEIAEFVESSLGETELGEYVAGVFWEHEPKETIG